MADVGTISGEKLSALTGLTDRRHRQLAKEGYFPPPLRGLYPAWPAITGLFKYHREQLSKKSDSLSKLDERAKTAKCEKTEAETALIVGKFIYPKIGDRPGPDQSLAQPANDVSAAIGTRASDKIGWPHGN